MSIRIETLEQLRDPTILEKVLDRLRRTTHPRPFAFKRRCKVLGDVPLLLTAPPGRKIKSSLLRGLRLGTPTQKGIVHREGQLLIFTFSKPVDATETARWIAKCMHDAKSPVPLKCIEIRQPSQDTLPTPTTTKASQEQKTTNTLKMDTPLIDDADFCDELPPIASELDELESTYTESLCIDPELEEQLLKHTSSKKIKWLRETIDTIQSIEDQTNQITISIEDIEEQLYDIESSIASLEHNLQGSRVSLSQNPWSSLFETCQATNWSLDEIRTTLSTAKVDTSALLRELQFLSDDDEMVAYKLVREYCTDKSQIWEDASQSEEWYKLRNQHQRMKQSHIDLCSELDKRQTHLAELESQQDALLLKYNQRRLEVFQKLQVYIQKPSATTELIQDKLRKFIQQLQRSV